MGCGCGKNKVRRATGTVAPTVNTAQRITGAPRAQRTVQAASSPYTTQQNVAPAHLGTKRKVV